MVPSIKTPPPGPRARALIERDTKVVSPSYTRGYPLVIERASGAIVEDVDGNVFLEAGNAFDARLAGFAPERLHGSAGLGFRTTGDRDQSFDLILAAGSTRFDQPFAIESVRVAIGVNRGF